MPTEINLVPGPPFLLLLVADRDVFGQSTWLSVVTADLPTVDMVAAYIGPGSVILRCHVSRKWLGWRWKRSVGGKRCYSWRRMRAESAGYAAGSWSCLCTRMERWSGAWFCSSSHRQCLPAWPSSPARVLCPSSSTSAPCVIWPSGRTSPRRSWCWGRVASSLPRWWPWEGWNSRPRPCSPRKRWPEDPFQRTERYSEWKAGRWRRENSTNPWVGWWWLVSEWLRSATTRSKEWRLLSCRGREWLTSRMIIRWCWRVSSRHVRMSLYCRSCRGSEIFGSRLSDLCSFGINSSQSAILAAR